jgi:hypothetical protein
MAVYAKEKLMRSLLVRGRNHHAIFLFLTELPFICRVAALNALMIPLHSQLALLLR